MHSGHRQRMKEKLLAGGMFPHHEILEMLLGFAIPRKDTNELAHRLIARFGSLDGVFSASYEELTEVRDVGDHCAFLLCLMPLVLKAAAESAEGREMRLNDMDTVAAYGEKLFRGTKNEALYVLLLDSQNTFIDCVRLAGGTAAGAEVNFRSIVENSSFRRSVTAVLLHNHPGGALEASTADRDFTARISELFSMLGVEVIEHIIMADGFYMRMLKNQEILPIPRVE